MASFSDIVKYQRSQGTGVVGSLATAIGQSTLQKIDPRNILFNRTGTMASLFPFLKGYQAKVSRKDPAEKIKPFMSQGFDEKTTLSISRIETNTTITAKNSLVLPMMARDMNLMRQNIRKLVTISGQTPANKADMFFKRSAEREMMYESQFKRAGGERTPTKVEPKKEEKKSWLSSLFESMFGFILPMIGKGILIGGLAVGLKTLFENDEVRSTVKDFLSGYFDKILDWTKEFVKENWQYLLGALALAFPLTTLNLIGKGLSTLASAFTTPLFLKLLGVLGAGAAGYQIGKEINERTGLSQEITDVFMSDKDDEVRRMLNPDAPKTTLEKFSERSGNLAVSAARAAVFAAGTGAGVAKTASIIAKTPTAYNDTAAASRTFLSGKGIGVNSKEYEKVVEIFKKVANKTPGFMAEFWRRMGQRLNEKIVMKLFAVFAGVAAAPISAGISLLISVLSGAMLIYDIVQIAKILDEIFNDLEEEEKFIELELSSEQTTSPIPAGQGEFDTGAEPTLPPTKIKVSKKALSETPAEEQRRITLSSTKIPTPATTGTTGTTPTLVAGPVQPYGGYNNREEFTRAMTPWAQKAAEELKVPAEAIISQWGLETAWGRKGAVQGQFNYGNIQGTYRESEPGLDAGRPRNFIKYSSMQDFVNDYVKQLKNPRYDLGKESLGSQQFFEKLKKGGYAEDPNYVATLMNITKDTKLASTPTMTPSSASSGALASVGVSPKQDLTKKTESVSALSGLSDSEQLLAAMLGFGTQLSTAIAGTLDKQSGVLGEIMAKALAESGNKPVVSVASGSATNQSELNDWWS